MQNLHNLFNQALTSIGHAASVTDPNDRSKASTMCQLWFNPARRAVMAAFHWSSLRVIARPPRVGERPDDPWQPGDPAPGYAFTHQLPADCLLPQYLAGFERFALGRRNGERVMYSNVAHPILHYTKDCTSPERWDVNLYNAIIYSLGASLNMAYSGKYAITQALERKIFDLITDASITDANSDDEYFEAMPGTLYGTGFTPSIGTPHFIYPTTSFRVAGIAA